jgi:hypothetical protein
LAAGLAGRLMPRMARIASLTLLVAAALAFAPAAATASPYGAHSMLYLTSPPTFVDAMLDRSAALGLRRVRLDVALDLVARPRGGRRWARLDRIATAARLRGQRLTIVVRSPPETLRACPAGREVVAHTCPTSQPVAFALLVAEVAERHRDVVEAVEVVNEPDRRASYAGTPAQYAATLRAVDAELSARVPEVAVALGGVAGDSGSRTFLRAVFRALGRARPWDVSNVHLRGRARDLPGALRSWRRFFADAGACQPVWVTETGYPSDRAHQHDPAHRGGEGAQARWLREALPGLVDAGAGRVFVTLRDNLEGAFASEGILGGTVADPVPARPVVRVKQGAGVVRELAQDGPPVRSGWGRRACR